MAISGRSGAGQSTAAFYPKADIQQLGFPIGLTSEHLLDFRSIAPVILNDAPEASQSRYGPTHELGIGLGRNCLIYDAAMSEKKSSPVTLGNIRSSGLDIFGYCHSCHRNRVVSSSMLEERLGSRIVTALG